MKAGYALRYNAVLLSFFLMLALLAGLSTPVGAHTCPPECSKVTSQDGNFSVEATASDQGTTVVYTYKICKLGDGPNFPDLSHFDLGIDLTCIPCDALTVIGATKECGTDPTTGLTGVKFDNPTDRSGNCWTVKLIVDKSKVNLPAGQVLDAGCVPFATKAGQEVDSGTICGPVCVPRRLEITCPATEIVKCNDLGKCGAVVTFGAPTVVGGVPPYTVACTPSSGSFFPVGTTIVTCTVKDARGTTASCTFKVIVKDCEKPRIKCPYDIKVPADYGKCSAKVTLPEPIASDNCGVKSVVCTRSDGKPLTDPFPVGTTTITCVVTDIHGNRNRCTFKVIVVDKEPPKIVCPPDIYKDLLPGDECPPRITLPTPKAWDNCRIKEIICTRSDGKPLTDPFPVGTTIITCYAVDKSGNKSERCTFKVIVRSAICGVKYFDKDRDGVRDGDEPGIPGFRIQLRNPGTDALIAETVTGADGGYCFERLRAGTYLVREVLPKDWIATTPTEVKVELGCPVGNIDFGNVCVRKVENNPRTLGFWANRGQSLIDAGDLAALNALNLVDAAGNDVTFNSAADVRSFLLGANATNMANALSAQLAAMVLNIREGFVNPGSFVNCPGLPPDAFGNLAIGDVVEDADAALAADGFTPAGDPNRAAQELLKNCLDAANNNQNFTGFGYSREPCPVVYY